MITVIKRMSRSLFAMGLLMFLPGWVAMAQAEPGTVTIDEAWQTLAGSENPEVIAIRTILAARARVTANPVTIGSPAAESRVASLERQVTRLEQQLRDVRSELFRLRSRM